MFNKNDPAKPNLIGARNHLAPFDEILLATDAETLRIWAAEFGSGAKIGEYAGLVHGRWAEPDGSIRTLSNGLFTPKAIFRGLDRPLFNHVEDADKSIFIYITNPNSTFRYPLSKKYEAGPLEELPAPPNSVFATYVCFQQAIIDELSQHVLAGAQPAGLVVGWEWLEQSPKMPSLPYDYDSRFEARVL